MGDGGAGRSGPGLRARLVTFFVLITAVPVLIASVVLQTQIDARVQARAASELGTVARGALSLLDAARTRAGDLAVDLSVALVVDHLAPLRAGAGAAQEWLAARVEPGERADAVLLVDADGQVLGSVSRPPQFAAQTPLDVEALVDAALTERVPPGVLLAANEVRGRFSDGPQRRFGWVIAARWTDQTLLEELGVVGNAALRAADGDVLAAVGARSDDLDATEATLGELTLSTVGDRSVYTVAESLAPAGGDPAASIVVWSQRPGAQSLIGISTLVVLPVVLLGGAAAWLLAGTVTAPVRRAADAARAAAAGDLDRRLPPTGGAELRDFALAFNAMASELDRRLQELSRSRDELRSSLDRLGDTLSSSLDLNRMLAVIVESSLNALGADRAILALFTPERDALFTKVSRGFDAAPPKVAVGTGRTGTVARTGRPLRVPDEGGTVPAPAPGEPTHGAQVVVPLLGRGRTLGVLSLWRDALDRPFQPADLDTLGSFAAQASVAMGNVLLHEEAQRLSVTDALTGLWNLRYFQLQAERELEAAHRYERHLSLAILDIDRFKQVNDTHGHQVGDHVLVEVAARLRDSVRVPDVVARYGGEEFVVLLPATDHEGARTMAERIRGRIAATPFEVDGRSGGDGEAGAAALPITCSVGVASFPAHGTTVAGLLRAADTALYAAKRAGRDRVIGAGDAEAAVVDA